MRSYSPQNVRVLRAALPANDRVSNVALREAMSAAYAAAPGELAPVHLLGGTVPDVSKLCECRVGGDPEKHAKALNAEVVRALAEAVESARRNQASYLAVANGWQRPLETPPSVKTDTTAMQFQTPA